MAKYRVSLNTTASMDIDVDVDDEGMDEQDAREAAIEKAYEETPPGICAQCSGWQQKWDLDLGEWEPDDETPVKKVED